MLIMNISKYTKANRRIMGAVYFPTAPVKVLKNLEVKEYERKKKRQQGSHIKSWGATKK